MSKLNTFLDNTCVFFKGIVHLDQLNLVSIPVLSPVSLIVDSGI